MDQSHLVISMRMLRDGERVMRVGNMLYCSPARAFDDHYHKSQPNHCRRDNARCRAHPYTTFGVSFSLMDAGSIHLDYSGTVNRMMYHGISLGKLASIGHASHSMLTWATVCTVRAELAVRAAGSRPAVITVAIVCTRAGIVAEVASLLVASRITRATISTISAK